MPTPTVSYTWMVVDEVSGHSWITREKSFQFDEAKNNREANFDKQLVHKLHSDARVESLKKTPHKYCSFILKTQYKDGKAPKVTTLATARLYREKNNVYEHQRPDQENEGTHGNLQP